MEEILNQVKRSMRVRFQKKKPQTNQIKNPLQCPSSVLAPFLFSSRVVSSKLMERHK